MGDGASEQSVLSLRMGPAADWTCKSAVRAFLASLPALAQGA
jgi:hypothetical protein